MVTTVLAAASRTLISPLTHFRVRREQRLRAQALLQVQEALQRVHQYGTRLDVDALDILLTRHNLLPSDIGTSREELDQIRQNFLYRIAAQKAERAAWQQHSLVGTNNFLHPQDSPES